MIGVFITINLAQAYFTPLVDDEAYYWMWSRHLAWGYFDHPPMIALWIYLGSHVLPGELGVRLVAVLLNSFSLFFFYKILNPLTRRQFILFTLLTLSTIVWQVFGFIATPDAPLLFFTLFYLYVWQRFIKNPSIINTLLFSIAMAGLGYSKYHGLLVLLFTLIPMMSVWWKNKRIYWAFCLAVLLYLPYLNWLFQNDFEPIRYHLFIRNSNAMVTMDRIPRYLIQYLLGGVGLLSGYAFYVLIKFKSKDPFLKSVWWLAVLTPIFFLISSLKATVQYQWLLVAYIPTTIVMYRFYVEKPGKSRWLIRLGYANLGLLLVARIVALVPAVSPNQKFKDFALKAGRFGIKNGVFERYQEASLFKFYNPGTEVAVHRISDDRQSQYTLWNSEEKFYGKSVDYVSQGAQGIQTFSTPKYFGNKYHIRPIAHYLVFTNVHLSSSLISKSTSAERISVNLTIYNAEPHVIRLNGNSPLTLTAGYRKRHNKEFSYITKVAAHPITIGPNQTKTIRASFNNSSTIGHFLVYFGIKYQGIDSSFLSKPFEMNVEK